MAGGGRWAETAGSNDATGSFLHHRAQPEPGRINQMDLFSALVIGRETLLGHGNAISAVADNISNSNTTGFKSQRPEFNNLLAEGEGSLYGAPLASGNGSFLDSLTTMLDQGALEATGRDLDFAIDGRGYFVVQEGTDNNVYTRAGNFSVDPDGNLVTADGLPILGFTAASPETLVPLNLSGVGASATPTTTGAISGNLDARAEVTAVPANAASFIELSAESTFSTPIQITDSLGASHSVAIHFFRNEGLNWTVAAYVDGEETGGTPGVPVSVGTTTLAFDGTGAQTATGAVLNIATAWVNGANASAVAMDLSKMVQYASASSINSITTDGNGAGDLVGFEVDGAGNLLGSLSNGDTALIGTIAVADFVNAAGLDRIGDSKFAESLTSGAADFGAALTEGRGSLKIKQLEGSNVDQATEFVKVIQYQRAYQAGAQVIQTASELIDKTLQIA
jgi:flagellar hook protein FlgE